MGAFAWYWYHMKGCQYLSRYHNGTLPNVLPPLKSNRPSSYTATHLFLFLPQRFLLCAVRPPHVKFSEINPDFLVSNPFLFFMYMKELSSPSVHIYMQQPPHCLTMYMYLLTVIPFAHTHTHTTTQYVLTLSLSSMQQFPYPPTAQDSFLQGLNFGLSLLLMLAFMYTFATIVKVNLETTYAYMYVHVRMT